MTQPAAGFPFAAVVGMESAREALLLLAVEPGLKGVLIAAEAGAGKTALARGFAALVDAAMVEVPLGVTEDRLVGGLDLERTLATGRRRIAPGLLARAHGAVLHVDEIGLLEPSLVRRILQALDTGLVRLESDGLSAVYPSQFTLIGTYDPSEGELSPVLVDAAGVRVTDGVRKRVEVLRRVEEFERDPAGFVRSYAAATARLKQQIADARARLQRVEVALEDRQRLSAAALRLGVEGHRADLFAVLLARARAALWGRDRVEEEDLQAAVDLVLAPRAKARPPSSIEEPAPEPAMDPGARASGSGEELVVPPLDTPVPQGLLAAQGAGRGSGRREGAELGWTRGRRVRTVAARPGAKKIAIEATLRAAAAYQVLRGGFRVTAGDLRFHQFRQRSGLLILFVVDASGSMAFHRIHQAKGAVTRLLRQAYLHRDRVAVVSFRGHRAELALPPSRSVELAKRAIDALAVGGGTPLGAALETALEVARRAGQGDLRRTLLVLLTDGRANVARNGTEVWGEIQAVCAALRSDGATSVVIDTRQRLVSGSECRRVAQLLGGKYVYLPRPDAQAVYDTVSIEAGRMRI